MNIIYSSNQLKIKYFFFAFAIFYKFSMLNLMTPMSSGITYFYRCSGSLMKFQGNYYEKQFPLHFDTGHYTTNNPLHKIDNHS